MILQMQNFMHRIKKYRFYVHACEGKISKLTYGFERPGRQTLIHLVLSPLLTTYLILFQFRHLLNVSGKHGMKY